MTKIQEHQFRQAQIWAAKDIPTRYHLYWLMQEMKRQRSIRRGLDVVITLRPSVNQKAEALQTVLGMIKEENDED